MAAFCITYNKWKPKEQKLREALCTLGNGYLGTRGAAEENPNNDFNYPETYVAGGFNRAHQAFLTREAIQEDMETTLENLRAWAKGEKAENEV